MRHCSEVEADARDEPAFSNGTQGYDWMSRWCDRCIHDDLEDNTYGPFGCPIVAVSMLGKTPAEWHTETADDEIFANYTCVEFRDKDNPDDREPEPPAPDLPGQTLLLPRAPFEAVRMLTPLPEPVGVPA